MPCLDDLWIRNQTPATMPPRANPVGWMTVKSEFPFLSPHSQELCGWGGWGVGGEHIYLPWRDKEK